MNAPQIKHEGFWNAVFGIALTLLLGGWLFLLSKLAFWFNSTPHPLHPFHPLHLFHPSHPSYLGPK